MEERIKALSDALAGSDITRVRTCAEDLTRTTQRIGQETASQPGAPAGNGTARSASSSTADEKAETIEGEYREV